MNCGCTCGNNWSNWSTPAFYTMTSGCGCQGYQTYGNNGWCTFLIVIFILFIICGVSKNY